MAKDDPDSKEQGWRRNVREGLGSIGKEMGYAVNSIRQEVVERPWFGRAVTPEPTKQWDKDNKAPQQIKGEPPKEISNDNKAEKEALQGWGIDPDDLYGKDPLEGRDPSEIDPEIEDGREHLQSWGIDPEDLYGSDLEQASDKEAVYGRDMEQDRDIDR